MKVIELHRSLTESNDRDADALRARMKAAGTLMINVMSSPGAGKTTLLSRLIRDMGNRTVPGSQEEAAPRPAGEKDPGTGLRIGVLEADIDASVDAERIEALGARSIQAHTDGMCHMDAGMTTAALDAMGMEGLDLIFLENVGNLICPAEFDTGAGCSIMLLSVPEGDDKPLKYPLMFAQSDALILTKTDALPYFNFDIDRCAERARRLNPDLRIFPVSAKTGDGMPPLEDYIREALTSWRQR